MEREGHSDNEHPIRVSSRRSRRTNRRHSPSRSLDYELRPSRTRTHAQPVQDEVSDIGGHASGQPGPSSNLGAMPIQPQRAYRSSHTRSSRRSRSEGRPAPDHILRSFFQFNPGIGEPPNIRSAVPIGAHGMPLGQSIPRWRPPTVHPPGGPLSHHGHPLGQSAWGVSSSGSGARFRTGGGGLSWGGSDKKCICWWIVVAAIVSVAVALGVYFGTKH
ncbi:hypothetical protein FQN49_007620 [Arthroderma sp. PD_2]|nr:hypothetical protein FQN49_007620 [Arthroderma sp. PD_2]